MDNNKFEEVNKEKLIDKDELIEALKEVSNKPERPAVIPGLRETTSSEAVLNVLYDIKKDLHLTTNILLFFLIVFIINFILSIITAIVMFS